MYQAKIRDFTDLEAWKAGHDLVLSIYICTNSFPQAELFGLVSQSRRAAISITSNIAEGFSRHSSKEKVQFYSIALGSTSELQNHLIIAKDLKFINIDQFNDLIDKAVKVHKITNGLIKSASGRSLHDTRYKIPDTGMARK